MTRSVRMLLSASVAALLLSACSSPGGTSDASPNFEAIDEEPVIETAAPQETAEETEPLNENLSTSQVCKRLTAGGEKALLFRVPEHVVEIMTDPDVSNADLAEIDYITEEIGVMIDGGPRYLTQNLEDLISVHTILSEASADGALEVSYSPGDSFVAAIELGEVCLEDSELDEFALDMIDLMEGAPQPR